MPEFKDMDGKRWEVKLTVAGLERVAVQCDFDLLNLLDNQLAGLAELYDKPIKLVQVLYAICEPQIERAGIEAEDFGELFAGPVLQDAADALVEAVALFYRNPKQGQILRDMTAKIAKGSGYHLTSVAERIDALSDDEIKSSVERSLSRTHPTEATVG